MSTTRTEYAVDYRDGTGPRKVPSGTEEEMRFAAARWVEHFNRHREGQPEAVLMARTVTVSEWTEVLK